MLRFVSMYKLEELGKEEMELYCSINAKIFEDCILYFDLIARIEQLNLNSNELYLFNANFNGLNLLFEIGQIHRTDHQEYLEEITFIIIESSRGKDMSLEDRVDLISEAWKDFFANLSNHH